jgi:hypothetical protein
MENETTDTKLDSSHFLLLVLIGQKWGVYRLRILIQVGP